MIINYETENNGFNLTRLCQDSCISGIRRARIAPFNGSQVKPMLGCKVTEHMTEYERTVQKTLRSIVAFSAVAVVALLLPFTGVFMPRGESFANWFARAGAPMTIFAIIAQNRVGRLSELLNTNNFWKALCL